MAGGGLAVTAENLWYLGFAKEATWGTTVTPTTFLQWLDGSEANPDAKYEEEREGDGGAFISLVHKTSQLWMIKISQYVRPITVGYILQALLGSGSDTYTAPSKSTTLSAAVLAGATSFSSTASLGNTGTLAINFTPGISSVNYEVQTVNLASQTGTGPYTYNLVAGAKFRNAHNSGDAITSASTHVFTRQPYTYDPYTFEAAFFQAGFGKAFRIADCCCCEVQMQWEKGKKIKLDSTWYGTGAAIQAAFLTPSYEGTSVIGTPGAPMVYYQAGGTWSLDNATTGNALTIEKLTLALKNGTDPLDSQSEGLSPVYFVPGIMDISGSFDVEFSSYQQYYETYFGSATPATGATDSYLVGVGQLSATLQPDAVNSLALSLPNISYKAPKLTPKLDGKILRQTIDFTGNKTAANPTPLQLTLTNSLASGY
jgi:hypothetical protein